MISGAFCYDVILDDKLNDWKPTNVSTITSCPKSYIACILAQWFFFFNGGEEAVRFFFFFLLGISTLVFFFLGQDYSLETNLHIYHILALIAECSQSTQTGFISDEIKP